MAQNHEFGRRAYPPYEPPPDPTLDPTTVSAPWKWAITGAIAAVLLLTMYGVTTRHEQVVANPPATTGSMPAPGGTAKPGG
jgi:hypothetical protein